MFLGQNVDLFYRKFQTPCKFFTHIQIQYNHTFQDCDQESFKCGLTHFHCCCSVWRQKKTVPIKTISGITATKSNEGILSIHTKNTKETVYLSNVYNYANLESASQFASETVQLAAEYIWILIMLAPKLKSQRSFPVAFVSTSQERELLWLNWAEVTRNVTWLHVHNTFDLRII